jgi:Ca-activated chloride channel family protein
MTLAHPSWLLLLLLLPVLAVAAVVISRRYQSRWHALVAPRLRGALIRKGSSLPKWLALIFLLAACAALIAALSRPQGDAGTKTEKTVGRNLMVALDLSRSMRVSDVKPDRLDQAKVVIYELLDKFPQDRIGLIGFAGTPYLYAPLTVDHAAVRETVGEIDETWPSVGGSDLASAIKLAIETLKKTGQKNNALIILSDGEEHEGDLDTMITEAERAGVFIYAIGVGTTEGGYVPNKDFQNGQMVDRNGNPVLSHLQPQVMQKLAEKTGGRYATASGGTNIPAMVAAAAAELDAFEMKGRDRRIVIEFYQWLLLPAIGFLIVSIVAGTRWRGLKAAALLIGAFAVATPRAAANEAVDARQALESKKFKEARDGYHHLAEDTKFAERAARYRIGEGTAAYRSGEYRQARSAFSSAMLSKDPAVEASAHLGMGNTLFQLGWQGLTDQSYPTEPGEVPDLARFETLVKERLARMKESDEETVGRSEEFIRMDSMILNWADAVRHYESSLNREPANAGAKQNRETTLIYLRKLRELLDEEKKAAEKSMPQPGQGRGQGQPQDGEGGGEPGEDGQGEGDPNKDGPGGDKDKDGKGKNGDKDKDAKGKGKGDPNESPEDRARRILSDNADLEKGPAAQGRFEYRNPEKDW